MSDKIAVILIALGGPRSLDEVGPFMASFMGRPAPQPVVDAIVERYKLIGGKSPLPELVREQAHWLERELDKDFRVYEGFRFSSPTIETAYELALKGGATRVIGLSMSPFETQVTTGSYRDAFDASGTGGIRKTFIPNWHDNPLFLEAWQERIFHGLKRYRETQRRHAAVIFTCHSIPEKYILAGDPYRDQIEETASRIAHKMSLPRWYIAWQSKGARATEPWIGPEVETILDLIAQEKKGDCVLEVPFGFTCDHMETMYDIDIVHRAYATKLGLAFERAESLNTSSLFIKALADVVKKIV
jgi:protoporphyrin/coproporphyrin ferrochelatase